MELSITNINREFSKKEDLNFILNIKELILKNSEVTFLMGHNGSGKSVLLKLLSGEIKPSKKKINFSKKNIRIGIVRQNASENLALELTVRQNLYLHLKPKTLIGHLFPSKELEKNAKKILEGHKTLNSKLNQQVSELSGGQKQALAFFAIISNNPDIICLDEFLSATDEKTKGILLNEVEKNKINRKIILIVSHDKQLAIDYADRIIVLNNGKLHSDFSKKDSEKWNIKYLEKQLN